MCCARGYAKALEVLEQELDAFEGRRQV